MSESDDGGNESGQSSSDPTSSFEAMCRIYNKDINDFTEIDSQIVIATEYALQQIMKPFDMHFDNKFQEIYEGGLIDGGKTGTIPRRDLEARKLPRPISEFSRLSGIVVTIMEKSTLFPRINFQALQGSVRMRPQSSTEQRFSIERAALSEEIFERETNSDDIRDILQSAASVGNNTIDHTPFPNFFTHNPLEDELQSSQMQKSGNEKEDIDFGLTKSQHALISRLQPPSTEKPILMSQFNEKEFQIFTNAVEGYILQHKYINLNGWIGLNSKIRFEMLSSLASERIIERDDEALTKLLNEPKEFVLIARHYLKVTKSSYKSETSHIDLMSKTLRFSFKTTDKEELRLLIRQWATFQEEFPELFRVGPSVNQTDLFEEVIRINNDPDFDSPLQTYFMSAMRDKVPPITTLDGAFGFLIDKWATTADMVEICKRIGMIFKAWYPKEYSQYQEKNKKRSFQDSQSSAYINTKEHPKVKDHVKRSTPDSTNHCKHCGINAHPEKSCSQDKLGPYYNPDMEVDSFGDSKSWAKCVRDFPKILEFTEHPRIPNVLHLKKYSLQYDQGATQRQGYPKKDGGKHHNSSSHQKNNNSKGSTTYNKYTGTKDSNKNNGSQKCKEPCTCTSQVSTHNIDLVANLAINNKSNYYNKINILNPEYPHDIIATSFALIDTGALHGSYAGAWLLTHKNLRKGKQFSNKQICSPINNTCISLTDSVNAYVEIFDIDCNFKFKYEIEFKILSSLDVREYGIIIGLPDIRNHFILDHFATQFMTVGKDINSSRPSGQGWKVQLPIDAPVGNSFSR